MKTDNTFTYTHTHTPSLSQSLNNTTGRHRGRRILCGVVYKLQSVFPQPTVGIVVSGDVCVSSRSRPALHGPTVPNCSARLIGLTMYWQETVSLGVGFFHLGKVTLLISHRNALCSISPHSNLSPSFPPSLPPSPSLSPSLSLSLPLSLSLNHLWLLVCLYFLRSSV